MKRSSLNCVEEEARGDSKGTMCNQVGPAASEGGADRSFQRSLVGRMWMGTGLLRKERMSVVIASVRASADRKLGQRKIVKGSSPAARRH
eukprot:1371021-Rhodomonas_salina.1